MHWTGPLEAHMIRSKSRWAHSSWAWTHDTRSPLHEYRASVTCGFILSWGRKQTLREKKVLVVDNFTYRREMRKAVVVAAVTTAAMAAAVAVLWSRWKQESERQWRKTRRILRKFARDCATPVSKLWLVADALVSDMNEALTSQETTTLNMPISYVASLPSGYSFFPSVSFILYMLYVYILSNRSMVAGMRKDCTMG